VATRESHATRTQLLSCPMTAAVDPAARNHTPGAVLNGGPIQQIMRSQHRPAGTVTFWAPGMRRRTSSDQLTRRSGAPSGIEVLPFVVLRISSSATLIVFAFLRRFFQNGRQTIFLARRQMPRARPPSTRCAESSLDKPRRANAFGQARTIVLRIALFKSICRASARLFSAWLTADGQARPWWGFRRKRTTIAPGSGPRRCLPTFRTDQRRVG
jgi:hypothetical protein